ncbi:MAG: D-glycero-beta-D-manno-heptose 1-phosphate adenylyltransferase [Chloroflexi bacterium]|nr:D-glycero-beta-D-manno-heptose 1-phosphate adenylyltransferase [Chloroflexota bacterium]
MPAVDLATACARRAEHAARGERVAATNGCFDLLHVGHVRYLAQARALGDALFVAVNSDRSARALKGPGRPLVSEDERAEILAALRCVECVVIFDEDTAEDVMAALRPDVYVKGGDYTRDRLPEARVVQAYGGEVRLLPLVAGRSTSQLIARIAAQAGAPRG